MPSLTLINRKAIAKITKGEYLIIEKLWTGQTNLEIAEKLFLSKNTVKTHVRNIYSKLNVSSKSALINFLREFR